MLQPNLCARAAEELEGWRWVAFRVTSPHVPRFLLPPDWLERDEVVLPDGVTDAPWRWFESAWGDEPPALYEREPLPSYPTDLNAVHRLEEELARRGRHGDYYHALDALIPVTPDRVFRIATASAAVRFAAVCEVCGWEE